MTVDEVRLLYEYHRWANCRVLESASILTDAQFVQEIAGSFRSVRNTLAHILGADWCWLARWKGVSPRALLDATEFPTLAALRSRWREVEADQEAFIDGLSDDALKSPLSYINIKGDPYTYPLGQTLQHVVNHASYHRGQAATLLRQLGAAASATDYLVFMDERA